MHIIAAITRYRAAAAMGTVHQVAAVTMITTQTMPEKPRVTLQYVWKMTFQRCQEVQEKKVTMATEQMAAVSAVGLQTEVQMKLALQLIHVPLCFHKEGTFHCVLHLYFLHMQLQHMHFIQLVPTTFQLSCILVYLYLLHQHLMVLDRFHLG